MDLDKKAAQLPALLKELRLERGISLRQLADHAGVNHSVAGRAERAGDAKLSTWDKLFAGLGYRLLINATELSEEAEGFLSEEAERRNERRREGLCAARRRFY